MNVGIVDYEGGNLASVARAVEFLGYKPKVTRRASELLSSDRVIFPGVGAAGSAMAALREAGLIECLSRGLGDRSIPCLGICIGIQMLFEHSEEDHQETLGVLKGRVRKFDSSRGIKVPHIGWNQVNFPLPEASILSGVESGDDFYFVNSYYVDPAPEVQVLGLTQYGGITFASMVQGGNWTATQFHLEKSGASGLKLLKNFLEG